MALARTACADPAVDAKGEAVARRHDRVGGFAKVSALPGDHMQDRAEHLGLERLYPIQRDHGRGDKMASLQPGRHRRGIEDPTCMARQVRLAPRLGGGVDERAKVGLHYPGIAHDKLRHGPGEQLQGRRGDIFLQSEKPQSRAPLAGAE